MNSNGQPGGSSGELLLQLQGVTKRFGGLTAVDSVDLDVYRGQIVSIIGPNGAGKTTVFNLITGIYPPTAGKMLLEGRSISGLSPDRVLRRGITRQTGSLRHRQTGHRAGIPRRPAARRPPARHRHPPPAPPTRPLDAT